MIEREAPPEFSRHRKPAVILRSDFCDEESHPCCSAQTITTKRRRNPRVITNLSSF
jgi:hypothetical protein